MNGPAGIPAPVEKSMTSDRFSMTSDRFSMTSDRFSMTSDRFFDTQTKDNKQVAEPIYSFFYCSSIGISIKPYRIEVACLKDSANDLPSIQSKFINPRERKNRNPRAHLKEKGRPAGDCFQRPRARITRPSWPGYEESKEKRKEAEGRGGRFPGFILPLRIDDHSSAGFSREAIT
mgnify:CR=1 FL=1